MPPETCQLLRTLWCMDPVFQKHCLRNGGVRAETQGMQTHHIWGGKTRLNRKSNLIRLCATTHDYMHMSPIEGRIACLHRQMERGVLDWETLSECAGQDARGWIENQEPRGCYQWMQRELLSHME